MNRVILALAIAALSSATLAGGAQAETIWRFPYKGMPYAVPHDHGKKVVAKVAMKPAERHVHR